jgi:Ca2+-binding RTX toxin-like protein
MPTGGSGNDSLTGNDTGEEFFGLAGDDTLVAFGGNDTLVGGAGGDDMRGGFGSDTFVIGSSSDLVGLTGKIDIFSGGTGADTVRVEGTVQFYGPGFVPAANFVSIERLELELDVGETDITASLVASQFGATALSTALAISGTTGQDTVFVRIDTASFSAAAFTFTDWIPAANLFGGDVLSLVGDTQDTQIIGSSRGDLMQDLGGNDSFDGRAGNDYLIAGEGNDTLRGGIGADTLQGGEGRDTYIVDVNDAVFEQPDAGIDTVRAVGPYTLTDNVENLTLVAGGPGRGGSFGNAGANRILGSSDAEQLHGLQGVDTIRGGAGNDTIWGGPGRDILFGDAGADAFVINAADLDDFNWDTLADFNPAEDTIWLNTLPGLTMAGPLAAAAFRAGSAATTPAHRILYDSSTGEIFFDADGTGSGAAIQIAEVAPATALTRLDFAVTLFA